MLSTAPRIVVTAGAIIRDSQDRILLQRRSDYGDWGLPGGGMEPGETIEQTMLREVREETGLELQEYQFHAVYSGPRMQYTYPDGNEVVFVMFLFDAYVTDVGPLVGDAETLELQFFALEEIELEQISSVQQPVFADLKKATAAVLRQ